MGPRAGVRQHSRSGRSPAGHRRVFTLQSAKRIESHDVRGEQRVLDRHQEKLLDLALWLRDVAIQSIHQLADFQAILALGILALQGLECRALDDRGVVAQEVVGAEQLTDFELRQLRIVHHVPLFMKTRTYGTFTWRGAGCARASAA